jgi:hypothetical protein
VAGHSDCKSYYSVNSDLHPVSLGSGSLNAVVFTRNRLIGETGTKNDDFSGEYALQIKNALAVKGFKPNITSFNGNYVGYIIPGRYYYLNEYESKHISILEILEINIFFKFT